MYCDNSYFENLQQKPWLQMQFLRNQLVLLVTLSVIS